MRCLARNPDKVKQLAELGCEHVKVDLSEVSTVQHAPQSMEAVYISTHTLAVQHKDCLHTQSPSGINLQYLYHPTNHILLKDLEKL